MAHDLSEEQRLQISALTRARETIAPEMESVADALLARVADKWTITVLEVLGEEGTARFTQIFRLLPGISQKMLTQTLKRMERDGLVTRTAYPVIPPRVDYELTSLGIDLGIAFCTVWVWAARNVERVEDARRTYDARDLG